jgi:tetratricopeptide (TPR) repeat protein
LGGHIIRDEYQPGALDQFEQLVDKALALDPDNLDAITLKVEARERAHDYPSVLKTIQRGIALAPADARLHLSLGDYYWTNGQPEKAIEEYKLLVTRGPGNDRASRRVYPQALLQASKIHEHPSYIRGIREMASRADYNRNPNDAWTLGSFAELFSRLAFFDDAIFYQRKALDVMDYGAGRRTLAIALYGKAAQMQLSGKDGSKLIAEARQLRVPPGEVVRWFDENGEYVAPFAATVRKLSS